jgi:hypothetical protein
MGDEDLQDTDRENGTDSNLSPCRKRGLPYDVRRHCQHSQVKHEVEDTRRDNNCVRVYASSMLKNIPDLRAGRAGENFGKDTCKVESDDDANVDNAAIVEPAMYRARQSEHVDPVEHDRHFKQHHSQAVENNPGVHPLFWLGHSHYTEGFLLAGR